MGLLFSYKGLIDRAENLCYNRSRISVIMDDCVWYEMINDGKWHVLILDLTKVPAVQDGVINYLRWDMFAGGQYNVIDMGYIAAFLSEQAAMEYDASLAEYYPD